MRLALPEPAALVLALGLLACGGGGGSPVAPVPPTPRGVSFVPQQAGDASIGLRGAVSGASLEVEIVAVGVDDLYGLSFELLFPGNLLRHEEAVAGAFPGFESHLAGSGRLLVGASHLGAVDGLSGSGTVAVVRFTAVANGSGTFGFSSQEAFDSFGDRIGLDWAGATIDVAL